MGNIFIKQSKMGCSAGQLAWDINLYKRAGKDRGHGENTGDLS
jgi:hypothetical protein